ncbi:MAG TPA: hypothetical protein VGE17_08545, partial [Methylophilus sp.]
VAGIDITRPFPVAYGVLLPSLHLDHQHSTNGATSQTMAYTSQPGTQYQLNSNSLQRNQNVISVGISYLTQLGISARMDFIHSDSSGGLHQNSMTINAAMPF